MAATTKTMATRAKGNFTNQLVAPGAKISVEER